MTSVHQDRELLKVLTVVLLFVPIIQRIRLMMQTQTMTGF